MNDKEARSIAAKAFNELAEEMPEIKDELMQAAKRIADKAPTHMAYKPRGM